MGVDSCQGSDGDEGCSSIDDLMLMMKLLAFPCRCAARQGVVELAHGGIGDLDEERTLIFSSFKGSDLIEKCIQSSTRFDKHEGS